MPRLVAASEEIASIFAAISASVDAKDTLGLGRGLKESFEKTYDLSLAPKVFEIASSEVGAAGGCSSGYWIWFVERMLALSASVAFSLFELC